MPLPYTLHQNNIRNASAAEAANNEPAAEAPPSPTYRAVTKGVAYVNIDDAIKCLTQSGSILKDTECTAVIYAFLDYLNDQLAEGNGFLSPHFRLTPGIRGVFKDAEDAYDPRRHRPSVNFVPGKQMQQAMHRMKVQRVRTSVLAPVPCHFQDWKSGTKDGILSPGHTGVIEGERLKITDPNDPKQGVFFLHLPTRRRFRSPGVFYNYPKQLQVPLPNDLPEGQYHLEVHSTLRTAAEVRVGTLPKPLTVNAFPTRQ